MKLIIISNPGPVSNEPEIIHSLFRNGLQYFHLRKPGMEEAGMESLLNEIPEEFYSRIVLHSHFHLVEKFRLKGYHFNRDSFEKATHPELIKGRHKSFSFHSFLEAESYSLPIGEGELVLSPSKGGGAYTYAFLSPIFNSISKENYKSCFDFEELKEFLKGKKNIIALGGVDEEKLEKIRELGFSGAAVLGAVWNSSDPLQKFIEISEKIKNLMDTAVNLEH